MIIAGFRAVRRTAHMKKERLTGEKRSIIKRGLDENKSFAEIGKKIGAAGSTISREVRNHLVVRRTGGMGHPFNACALRFSCTLTGICGSCTGHRCKNCSRGCNSVCSSFERQECPNLARPPYVCNGCKKRGLCTLEKRYYYPIEAQKEYEEVWSESHSGVTSTEQEIQYLDNLISPLILQGQSLNHILAVHAGEITVSQSTLYRMLSAGLFRARNLDLPRRVRFGVRKKSRQLKVDRSCRIGRTFQDFLAYMEDHAFPALVELDSVEGRKGGKVLLTIHFVQSELMLAFLRDANTSASVTECFDRIYGILGQDLFARIFPVCLADNGSEFSDPMKIECDWSGTSEIRTKVFYCDPSAPFQKGSAERNHEYIRMVIPKGTSLDCYDQQDIRLLMDHVNSTVRPGLGNRTPFEAFAFMYGQEVLDLLGVRKISPDQVTLKPDLLRSRLRAGHESD